MDLSFVPNFTHKFNQHIATEFMLQIIKVDEVLVGAKLKFKSSQIALLTKLNAQLHKT